MSDWVENHLETIKSASHIKRHALQTFFDFMKRGYIEEDNLVADGANPGSRKIDITKGAWRLIDEYVVTSAGPGSGGTTTIFYGDIPIWMMQYIGFYREEAIPCLKAALSANYNQTLFEGGRGPRFFVHEGVHYVNLVTENNFFGHSYGREDVYVPNGEHLGFHRYHSQWLAEGLW